MTEEKETSEFGMGFTYCLGLFLAHAEMRMYPKDKVDAELWFYGATDHLYDLQIPVFFTDEKKEEISAFRSFCMDRRLGEATVADIATAVQKAKDLLRDFDMALGIKTIKGDCE